MFMFLLAFVYGIPLIFQFNDLRLKWRKLLAISFLNHQNCLSLNQQLEAVYRNLYIFQILFNYTSPRHFMIETVPKNFVFTVSTSSPLPYTPNLKLILGAFIFFAGISIK